MSTKPKESLEIERKYEMLGHGALPEVTVAGNLLGQATEFRMSAAYYDTPGHELGRQGIALRHRTGGNDSGWHLKQKTGAGVREVFWATQTEVPEGARAEIAGLLGVAAPETLTLNVIATIDTVRQAATLSGDPQGPSPEPVLEIVDDRVRATDHTRGIVRVWREWEAELLTEDEAFGSLVLDKTEPQLLAAGAFPSLSEAKIQRALGLAPLFGWRAPDHLTVFPIALIDLADQLESFAELPEQTPGDDEAVHQIRSLLRRARVLLRVASQTTDEPLARVERVAQHLAALRNRFAVGNDARTRWEIGRRAREAFPPAPDQPGTRTEQYHSAILSLLAEEWDGFRAELRGAGLRSTDQRSAVTLTQEVAGAGEQITAASVGLRVLAYELVRSAQAEVSGAPAGPGTGQGSPLSIAALKRATKRQRKQLRSAIRVLLERGGEDLSGSLPEARLHAKRAHRVRKEARTLRYAIEALTNGAPVSVRTGIFAQQEEARARAVHQGLGRVQDALLLEDWLRERRADSEGTGTPLGEQDRRAQEQLDPDALELWITWARTEAGTALREALPALLESAGPTVNS